MGFAFFLGGCGDNQQAYFTSADPGKSVTLVREQAYLGGAWQASLIVAGLPQCQRRYPMEGLAENNLRIDVFQPEAGVFILNAGKRWYVMELQSCRLQSYTQPPPEPGDFLGLFQVQNNVLRFIKKPSAKGSPDASPGSPDAQ